MTREVVITLVLCIGRAAGRFAVPEAGECVNAHPAPTAPERATTSAVHTAPAPMKPSIHFRKTKALQLTRADVHRTYLFA